MKIYEKDSPPEDRGEEYLLLQTLFILDQSNQVAFRVFKFRQI